MLPVRLVPNRIAMRINTPPHSRSGSQQCLLIDVFAGSLKPSHLTFTDLVMSNLMGDSNFPYKLCCFEFSNPGFCRLILTSIFDLTLPSTWTSHHVDNHCTLFNPRRMHLVLVLSVWKNIYNQSVNPFVHMHHFFRSFHQQKSPPFPNHKQPIWTTSEHWCGFSVAGHSQDDNVSFFDGRLSNSPMHRVSNPEESSVMSTIIR